MRLISIKVRRNAGFVVTVRIRAFQQDGRSTFAVGFSSLRLRFEFLFRHGCGFLRFRDSLLSRSPISPIKWTPCLGLSGMDSLYRFPLPSQEVNSLSLAGWKPFGAESARRRHPKFGQAWTAAS